MESGKNGFLRLFANLATVLKTLICISLSNDNSTSILCLSLTVTTNSVYTTTYEQLPPMQCEFILIIHSSSYLSISLSDVSYARGNFSSTTNERFDFKRPIGPKISERERNH